jgi:hypothetical protein
MTDFTRVLLTDRLAWEFFGLAARERLLYKSDIESNVPAARLGAVSQRVLSLLVLFDKVIVHDFSEGVFRIPDLEMDDILQVIAQGNSVRPVEPLRTRWRLGPLKSRRRPPASLLRSLRLFKEERPLVVERLLSVESNFDRSMASALGVSRRQYVNALFDYALACVEGDQATIRINIFQRLPDEMLRDLTNELFDFQRRGDLLDPINAKLVFAIAFADELRIIQELSEELGVGVATEHYCSKHSSVPSAVNRHLDATSAADHYVILRAALAEDQGVFPRIRDIRHALALRRDPNLRSLREMLVEFHKAVQAGDTDTFVIARREVARAKRAIARREAWQRRLDWISYFSLPLSIAETLTGAPPIAGTTLSVLGATGTAAASRAKKRHGWVLFNL